jgi:trk system potassium uptake protein TrkA
LKIHSDRIILERVVIVLRILMIGGGDVTKELLNRVNLKQHEIIIVEKDQNKCAEIGEKYDVLVINKDATDVSIYTKDIDMTALDAILALTDKDEVNVFVLTIAKLYNVPFRLARVKSNNIAELIMKLDLGVPITIPSIVSNMIKNFLDSLKEAKFITELGNMKLYWMTLTSADKAMGRRLDELGLPDDVKILLVFDGNSIRTLSSEEILNNGYQLLLMSEHTDIEEIIRLLKG